MLKTIFSVCNSKNKKHKIITIFGLKLKIKRTKDKTQILNKKIELLEKIIIENSGMFDPEYYTNKYNLNLKRFEALDHYYKIGIKKEYNPSKYIDVKYSRRYVKDKNPILELLNPDSDYFFPNKVNSFKNNHDSERIKSYIEYKKTRKAKGVVYTCITNDYDDINEISIYKYINPDWDYVCYTDNKNDIEQKQIGIWEIRPLVFDKLDNTRNNRYHKINAHLLFPEYDESIYLDSNINILTDFIFERIKNSTYGIVLPSHFRDVCIYQEYNIVKKRQIDDIDLITKELEIIKEAGMPRLYGFAENNIIYRKHNQQNIKNIMDEWWYMVSHYSKRDQLSLVYLLWKYGIDVKDITFKNARLNYKNFALFAHKKNRETIKREEECSTEN